MTTIKFSGAEHAETRMAVQLLKDANKALSGAKKQADAAKDAITALLLNKRGINLETLEIGDVVSIDGLLLIKVNSQNKFDEKSFMLQNPAQHEAFKKDFAVKRFEPLI